MWTKDTEIIKRGSKGDLVMAVQRGLDDLGYEVGPLDGIFGKQTQEAVKKFQHDNHLEDDGIVGFMTGTTLERVFYEKHPEQHPNVQAKAAAAKAQLDKAIAEKKAAAQKAAATPVAMSVADKEKLAAKKAAAAAKEEGAKAPVPSKEVSDFLGWFKK